MTMSTITRKPRTIAKKTTHPTETEIQAVIRKGLSGPTGDAEDEEEAQVKLRLPVALLKRVDAAVKAQPIKTSRHRWLIEAIVEKLGRESV
jgi:hypothetical protein